jgi:hypothetical protein
MWIGHDEVAKGPGHPFYEKVNELFEEAKFDEFVEKECAKFYAENNGRPSVPPGIYFRLLLLGYGTGAVLAVTLQEADQGDTATVMETLIQAGENVAELMVTEAEKAPEEKPQVHLQDVVEVVTDKGYHSAARDEGCGSSDPEKKQPGQRD